MKQKRIDLETLKKMIEKKELPKSIDEELSNNKGEDE